MDEVLENNLSTICKLLEGDAVGIMNFIVHEFFSETLLHIAVSYGNYELCKTLLESGAEVKVLKSNDETPERTKRQNEHL